MVGGSSVAIDLTLLNLFTAWLGHTGTGLEIANMSAFLLAALNSYAWNRRWTFEGQKHSWDRFAMFMSFTLVGALINTGILVVLVHSLGAHSGLPEWVSLNGSKVGATVVSAGWNYVCYRWLFYQYRKGGVKNASFGHRR